MTAIRLARPEDGEALSAIYAPYVRETTITFEYDPPTPGEFRRRVETTLTRYPWLVLEEEGELLGYAYASRYQSRAAYQWGAEGSVYLARDRRGKGLGISLYRCLMELLAEQGVRRFYACITHPNPASESFHRRMGFTQLGLFPQAGFKLGKWLDILWMGLPLGDQTAAPEPFRPFPDLSPERVAEIIRKANPAL